jgi:hypothetical protein
MNAAGAIDLARASGIALTLEGEGIRYRAPADSPIGALDQLSANKAEVIELLEAEHGGLTAARVITLAEIAGYRLSLGVDETPMVVAPANRSLIIENIVEKHQARIGAWLRYERDAVDRWIGRINLRQSRSQNDCGRQTLSTDSETAPGFGRAI